jgi:hypothetical protein
VAEMLRSRAPYEVAPPLGMQENDVEI